MYHRFRPGIPRANFLSGAAAATLVAASSAAAHAADLTSLDIGTSSDPNNGGLLIVAERMGYFKDNGLDVTLKFFPSAGDMVTAMAAGSLFMGAGSTVPTATLRGGGFPVVIVAQQADISGAQAVVCQKDIMAPKDFVGKKVGALFGTTPEMFADAMFQKYNIPLDKVTLVNLGAADMITALLRGDIQGAVLWEPWSSQAVQGGAKLLLTGTDSYIPGQTGPNPIIGVHSVLVAPKPWVDAHPQIVSAVLKAEIAAAKFIAAQPDKAAEQVGSELRVAPALMKQYMARNQYSMKIDKKLVNDMTIEAAFLLKKGKLKTAVEPGSWIDPSVLHSVDASFVTWKAG